jgi:soluble lytic murein transglycosylase
LGNQPLFDLETNELLHSGKEAALKPDFAKSIDEKSFREKRLLLLADLLARNKNYIASFRIIQAGLSGREIIPSNDILKTLFPLPIYVHAIGKMTADIDPVVILSLIRQESAFNPAARSPAGARGLMQIMPQTARRLSKKVNRRDLYLPNTNIKLGVSYFKGLLKKYDGNLVYALMAYNAGEHRVATWIRRDVLSSHSILHTIESIPYKETQNYVKLILRNLFFYKYLVNGEGVDDMAIGKIFDVSRVPAKEN